MSILDLAIGGDQELALKAVLEMKDQTELLKIASDKKYAPLLRRTAVSMLTDIDALRRLAACDKNWRISISTYRQLHRMNAIPKVPAGENSFALWLPDHADGMPRLADVPLCHVTLTEVSFTENLAKAALFCISSPKDMSFIARHDQRPAVRRAALKKAQEEDSFYLKFALHDLHSGVCLAAAERLTGGEAVDAVLREGSGSAQAVAAKKTSNMQLLKKTAIMSDYSSIHRIALTRVEDWTLLEIIAMLGRTQGIAKGTARWRMECMQTQWLESGFALLPENQKLYADAARNDRKFYNLVIEHITDEDCLAEILCSLSPHQSGATSYGPIGEAGYIINGAGFPSSNPKVVARTLSALDRIHSPQALKKVAECARTNFLRNEAMKRIET